MKFKCGGCEKYFKIDNADIIDTDLIINCDNCDNQFVIKSNLAFSSSSKNSTIICQNCGKLLPESQEMCDGCNLFLNKGQESLRIDNKYYDSLEIRENGAAYNEEGKNLGKRKLLIPLVIIITLVSLISSYYFLRNNQSPSSVAIQEQTTITTPENNDGDEIQIVIMKSGETYFAKKMEYLGDFVNITSRDGTIRQVLGDNIMQITTAVIEK